MRKTFALFIALLLVSALSLSTIGCSEDAMVKPEPKATEGKAAAPAAPAAEPAAAVPAAPAAEATPTAPAAPAAPAAK
jgi:hypothetical protein